MNTNNSNELDLLCITALDNPNLDPDVSVRNNLTAIRLAMAGTGQDSNVAKLLLQTIEQLLIDPDTDREPTPDEVDKIIALRKKLTTVKTTVSLKQL